MTTAPPTVPVRAQMTSPAPPSGYRPSAVGWPEFLAPWRSGRMDPRRPRGGPTSPEYLAVLSRAARGDFCSHAPTRER